MSKDSSFTYVHLHASHHADLMEEFCHPPSANSSNLSAGVNNLSTQQQSAFGVSTDPTDPSLIHLAGHFLPFESINLPAHLMPVNPEDEDGVVPDMHAAFGITRAMGQSGAPDVSGERSGRGVTLRAEDTWQDFGLESLTTGMTGLGVGSEGEPNTVSGTSADRASGVGVGVRREGRRNGILNMR